MEYEESIVTAPGFAFPDERQLIGSIMRNQLGKELGIIVGLKTDSRSGLTAYIFLSSDKPVAHMKELLAIPIAYRQILACGRTGIQGRLFQSFHLRIFPGAPMLND
jgi:hypothetical protein